VLSPTSTAACYICQLEDNISTVPARLEIGITFVNMGIMACLTWIDHGARLASLLWQSGPLCDPFYPFLPLAISSRDFLVIEFLLEDLFKLKENLYTLSMMALSNSLF
jgi:hypothetical protein